jgi:xanthine dehydrogenase molybdopterin-binding subunit B
VTSTRSHAKILSIDQSEALKLDGVIDFICKDDVPGKNNYGVIIQDDQLFADGEV